MTKVLPFQEEGARWLAERPRAYLADVPGLGKTRTALVGARFAGAHRVLVLAPAVATIHWQREAGEIDFDRALKVVSYAKYVMSATERNAVASFRPDLVILDEAHFLKHGASKRARSALGLAARAASRAWALSGTPMPRNPMELYSIVSAFWPDAMRAELGISSARGWLERFTVWAMGDYGPRIFAARNAEQLNHFLFDGGRMLRRREQDVLPDLPALHWTVLELSPTPEAEKMAWEATNALTPAERAMLSQPGGMQNGNTSRARHILGDIKAPFAAALIAQELRDSPDEKRVVFAYHRSVLDALSLALAEFGVARVDGQHAAPYRAAMIDAFQYGPDTRVFLGQIEAAGTAISLTAAHRVDIVEPDWRTDFNVQAGKRAHRFGQTQDVRVRMLTLADTLDEVIVRQHHREVTMVGRVLRETPSGVADNAETRAVARRRETLERQTRPTDFD